MTRTMIRTLLSGLAVVAVLAVLAHVPADAQQRGQRGEARLSHSGGDGNARSVPRRSQRLRSGGRQPSAIVPGSSILSLGVLRRKCLDGLPPDPCHSRTAAGEPAAATEEENAMKRTILSSLAVAAILAMTAGGAVGAEKENGSTWLRVGQPPAGGSSARKPVRERATDNRRRPRRPPASRRGQQGRPLTDADWNE